MDLKIIWLLPASHRSVKVNLQTLNANYTMKKILIEFFFAITWYDMYT